MLALPEDSKPPVMNGDAHIETASGVVDAPSDVLADAVAFCVDDLLAEKEVLDDASAIAMPLSSMSLSFARIDGARWCLKFCPNDPNFVAPPSIAALVLEKEKRLFPVPIDEADDGVEERLLVAAA